jgi:hypothetical protein
MSDAQTRQQLFSTLDLNYGPIGFLGRVLLKAEFACQQRGVHLAFVSARELQAINEANSSSWTPLLPLFDHRYNTLSDANFFAIVGRDSRGEIVACQGARHFDWAQTNYFDECSSLRLFYGDDTTQKLPEEECAYRPWSLKSLLVPSSFQGRPGIGLTIAELAWSSCCRGSHERWRTQNGIPILP